MIGLAPGSSGRYALSVPLVRGILTYDLGLLRSPERVYCVLEGYGAEMLQPLAVPRTFEPSLGYAVQLLHNDG